MEQEFYKRFNENSYIEQKDIHVDTRRLVHKRKRRGLYKSLTSFTIPCDDHGSHKGCYMGIYTGIPFTKIPFQWREPEQWKGHYIYMIKMMHSVF